MMSMNNLSEPWKHLYSSSVYSCLSVLKNIPHEPPFNINSNFITTEWVLFFTFLFSFTLHTLCEVKKFEGNSKEVTYKVVVSLITTKKIENTVSTRLHQAVQVYNLTNED